MEPFSKDDPLHKLLGKSRVAEPRPNFTQNVLRAVRQEPQILAVATVLTLSLLLWKKPGSPNGSPSAVVMIYTSTSSPSAVETAAAEMPVEAVVASELETLDHLSVMLAQQNTSAMTDSEIASLLS